MGFLFGVMVVCMMACGKMGSNMEEEFLDNKMVWNWLESGMMGRG